MFISVVAGTLAYLATAHLIENEARARFAKYALTAQYAIDARLKSYTDVLVAVASLFEVMDVSADQFHEFVARLSLETKHPALESINFAVYLRDQDRTELDRRVGRGEAGDRLPIEITPPGKRDDYLVLAFAEPHGNRSQSIGRDVLPNGNRALSMEARDTGRLTVSGTPVRPVSGPNRVGLSIRIPVYRIGLPLATVSDRRAAYIGSAGIGFKVDRLMRDVLPEMPVREVRLTVVDAGVIQEARGPSRAPEGRVLFDSDGTDRQPAPPLATGSEVFSITMPVDYHGRTWKATFSTARSKLYTDLDAVLPWVALATGFIVSLLVYLLLRSLMASRQRAIKLARGMTFALRASQSKLRQLAAHADQIKEGERKRIAREIHDDLGQNLLVLRIEAGMLAERTRTRHPLLHARASTTVLQIDATIKSVRAIINDLRPSVLDLGLNAAVEWQVAEFRRRTGLECEFAGDDTETALDDYRATAFFRILQESMSNIVRHAHATRVWVALALHGQCMTMTVSDNGIGLPEHRTSKPDSFGLIGIEERIKLLGGRFSINRGERGGTTVHISVPFSTDTSAPVPAQADTGAAGLLIY